MNKIRLSTASLSLLVGLTLGLSYIAVADVPPAGSTVPCGDSNQCGTNVNACPASAGWVFLPPSKWIKCCQREGTSQYFFWYWLKVEVYNKAPQDANARCYRTTDWVKHEACTPGAPCKADAVPAAD